MLCSYSYVVFAGLALLGPIDEKFVEVTDLYAPLADGREDNAFISRGIPLTPLPSSPYSSSPLLTLLTPPPPTSSALPLTGMTICQDPSFCYASSSLEHGGCKHSAADCKFAPA